MPKSGEEENAIESCQDYIYECNYEGSVITQCCGFADMQYVHHWWKSFLVCL
jgi:hypothetical protein